MAPAWIAPSTGSTIKFEFAPSVIAEHSAGGACVPSANAGERGQPTPANLADLFTSPLGIGLLFALTRKLMRSRRNGAKVAS